MSKCSEGHFKKPLPTSPKVILSPWSSHFLQKRQKKKRSPRRPTHDTSALQNPKKGTTRTAPASGGTFVSSPGSGVARQICISHVTFKEPYYVLLHNKSMP